MWIQWVNCCWPLHVSSNACTYIHVLHVLYCGIVDDLSPHQMQYSMFWGVWGTMAVIASPQQDYFFLKCNQKKFSGSKLVFNVVFHFCCYYLHTSFLLIHCTCSIRVLPINPSAHKSWNHWMEKHSQKCVWHVPVVWVCWLVHVHVSSPGLLGTLNLGFSPLTFVHVHVRVLMVWRLLNQHGVRCKLLDSSTFWLFSLWYALALVLLTSHVHVCLCSAMMISIVMWDFRNHKNVVLVNTCSLISTSTSNTLMAIEQSNCQSIEWLLLLQQPMECLLCYFSLEVYLENSYVYSVQCPSQTGPLTWLGGLAPAHKMKFMWWSLTYSRSYLYTLL